MSITPKQKLVLDFIQNFTKKHRYGPSQKEIAEAFGFKSLGTVQDYLVILQREGHLEKQWNGKRTLKVLSCENTLPLLGHVAAGHPIEAIDLRENVEVPQTMLKSKGQYFALKIKGQSMIEDGIFDQDIVVIRKQATAENGQTVVALIDNEATIKRFYRRAGHIELHPANESYKPIIVREQNFKIEGIMCGLIRHLK